MSTGRLHPCSTVILAYQRSRECARWSILPTPAEQNVSGNALRSDAIVKLDPAVLACTVYLWDVERSIRLLTSLKKRLPHGRTFDPGWRAAVDGLLASVFH